MNPHKHRPTSDRLNDVGRYLKLNAEVRKARAGPAPPTPPQRPREVSLPIGPGGACGLL